MWNTLSTTHRPVNAQKEGKPKSGASVLFRRGKIEDGMDFRVREEWEVKEGKSHVCEMEEMYRGSGN